MVSRLAFPAVLAAAFLSLGAAPSPPRPDVVAYTLAPELDSRGLTALDVSVRFAADAAGPTRLELPDKAAGVSELWRNIRDLRIEGARSVQAPSPAVRLIEAAPGARLTVRYRVVSAFDHDPATPELETYQPTIRPRWFWAYGETLFAHPKGGDRRATFQWAGPPGSVPFASDLEHAAGRPISMDDLDESVVIGGPDMVLARRTVEGAPVRIAMVGGYPFPDETFADTVTRVIAGERAFWGRREGPFLVAIAALTPVSGSTSIRGEGRGDAFAILASADASLGMLKGVLAHEYFHTWNPERLGGIYDGAKEPAAYWFSEGFTDFYARRLLVRMGGFDLDAFAADWNAMLSAYAGSMARESPGARVLSEFWTNPEVEKLPYQRGAMLAAIWDRRLRAASNGQTGLDDVMRAMRDRVAAAGGKGPKAPELFVATAAEFGLDVRDDLARFVERGEPLLLPAGVFGSCLELRTATIPIFATGYKLEHRGAETVFMSVEPQSPAYAAGLRPGMRLVRREAGVYGDSRATYRLRVTDGSAERVIAFQPEGARRETLQELYVPAALTPQQRRACEAEAAGLPAPAPPAVATR